MNEPRARHRRRHLKPTAGLPVASSLVTFDVAGFPRGASSNLFARPSRFHVGGHDALIVCVWAIGRRASRMGQPDRECGAAQGT